ncbi:MAG: hypothetical protein Q9162_006343 [Coniocarpon cinnabarinum]
MPRLHSFTYLLLSLTSVTAQPSCPALDARASLTNESAFDYVIVGGGTSGLVLANRLSADPSVSVAVIEAGSSQRDNPNVTSLGSYGRALGTEVDWTYTSAPQVFANNKPQTYDAGKGLGQSTACRLTLMTSAWSVCDDNRIRAATAQIDTWETRFGNQGWNWANLFPYYLKSETFQIPDANQTQAGCNFTASVHGESGPVEVGWFNDIAPRSTYLEVRAAWEDAGFTWIPDPNTGNASGASNWPLTVSRAQNIRWDAANAYLYSGDVMSQRSNLQVFENTTAQRILWTDEQDDKAQASGVEVIDQAGDIQVVSVNKEVILSAGSLKSPVLLEASGVGNRDVLNANGIPVKVDLPSVGFNLQDQPNVPLVASAPQNFTGYPTYVTHATANDLFGNQAPQIYSHLLAQLPSYAQTITSRAAANVTTPEIQQQLLKIQLDLMFVDFIPMAELLTAPSGSNLVIAFWTLLPLSRGSVHINKSISNDPIIDPHFFMLDSDHLFQAATARLGRSFFSAAQTSGFAGSEISPGLANVSSDATDEQWKDYFINHYGPNSHPVGTAAMMRQDLGGVVDASLTVYGVSNVRVVDASILPAQVDGHLTSTLYAVAERAADIILGRI